MLNDINWGRTSDFLAAQLWVAQMKIYTHFAEWFADTGLTAKQFGVLYVISLNPSVNQRQLANLHYTKRASFGETLARLEEKGLVERSPSPIDKRAKLMSVTPAGNRAIQRVLGGIVEMAARPDLVHPDRSAEQSGVDQDRLQLPDGVSTAIWWYASYPNLLHGRFCGRR